MMKSTVADLLAATENAERAIASLKTAVNESDKSLGVRLREAEGYCASLDDNLRAGEELLNRLRKIAYANNLLGGETAPVAASAPPAIPPSPPAPEPTHDAKSVAAAAQAFADRARARAQAHVPVQVPASGRAA